MGYLTASILRPGATYIPENFKLWERRGYHVTPVHFYSPIPDTREMERREFRSSACTGIDLRATTQLGLLRDFSRFAPEYDALPRAPVDNGGFYLQNDAFQGIDPHVYCCMQRHFQPKTIIEVGSGYSTLLGAQIARHNDTRYLCIDPWPRDFVSKGIAGVEFIKSRVEDLDVSLFTQLQANDILFVDSSHVVRTASDVCFLILEVLPRLKAGVIVHFHDIFLPFEYPKEWITKNHSFWTEQYLLQAYLSDNTHAEVLFANHFMATTYPTEIRATFSRVMWANGASFWIRKR